MRDSDAEAVAREINNYEVVKNLARVPFPYAVEDARSFIQFANALDARSGVFAVELQGQSELVGVVSFEWSDEKDDTEFGYWYAQPMWGQGIATEAGRAVVQRAFETTGCQKLVAGCHADNPASRRVLEKLGFKLTGLGRAYSLAQKRELSSYRLELLRDAWLQNTRLT